MNTLHIKERVKDYESIQTDDCILCPECGAVMDQVDQLKEGYNIFTWFECSKDDCNGQWLQKQNLITGM